MKAITNATGSALQWNKPKLFERRYELRDRGEVIAAMTWDSLLGCSATATTAEGIWRFRRHGIVSSRVTIARSGSETEIATFVRRWTGSGTLQTPGGEPVAWIRQGFWGCRWLFVDTTGRPLVRFHSTLSARSAAVEIEPEARSHRNLALLLVLGWYLIVLEAQDGAAASAAVFS
jgi:hypothetical protein